jgi:hypothetical protein
MHGAFRLWQVRIAKSEYARMNGTVIVTRERSGKITDSCRRKRFRKLKM